MRDRWGFDWTGVRGTHFWRRPKLSRRLFFRHAASAVGGYFLMPTRPMETVARGAASPKGTAKNVIFVLMAGGPSHTDTFDLKEGAWTPEFFAPESYGDIRWPRGILPLLAERIEDFALVRSVKSWAAVHQLSQTWVQIGRNPASGLARIAPHIGSVVSLELGDMQKAVLPPFLSMNVSSGPGAGYLAPEHGAFYISPGGNGLGNSSHRDGAPAFQRRYNLLNDLDAEARGHDARGTAYAEMQAFNLSARKLMYNDAVSRAFTWDADTRTRYGNTGFGNACIATRNILQAGLGTRFVQITIGGWDNHQNIYQPNANLQARTREFDNGLGALLGDLKESGLLDETLVVAMGEFGRTVGPLNNQNGRDHFLQQSLLVAGARVRGGRAIGATDSVGGVTVETGWRRDREIRAEDIEATMYSALGIDWTTIRRDDPLGRGFEYVPFADRDLYGPVHELWS
ncbi:MAG TPA: DUF1501 domain-containing protein [Bryobacteraceae bacterium]|nr:DUF1501 domain-containing protein [Bryobacteraceae bacterium]